MNRIGLLIGTLILVNILSVSSSVNVQVSVSSNHHNFKQRLTPRISPSVESLDNPTKSSSQLAEAELDDALGNKGFGETSFFRLGPNKNQALEQETMVFSFSTDSGKSFEPDLALKDANFYSWGSTITNKLSKWTTILPTTTTHIKLETSRVFSPKPVDFDLSPLTIQTSSGSFKCGSSINAPKCQVPIILPVQPASEQNLVVTWNPSLSNPFTNSITVTVPVPAKPALTYLAILDAQQQSIRSNPILFAPETLEYIYYTPRLNTDYTVTMKTPEDGYNTFSVEVNLESSGKTGITSSVIGLPPNGHEWLALLHLKTYDERLRIKVKNSGVEKSYLISFGDQQAQESDPVYNVGPTGKPIVPNLDVDCAKCPLCEPCSDGKAAKYDPVSWGNQYQTINAWNKQHALHCASCNYYEIFDYRAPNYNAKVADQCSDCPMPPSPEESAQQYRESQARDSMAAQVDQELRASRERGARAQLDRDDARRDWEYTHPNQRVDVYNHYEDNSRHNSGSQSTQNTAINGDRNSVSSSTTTTKTDNHSIDNSKRSSCLFNCHVVQEAELDEASAIAAPRPSRRRSSPLAHNYLKPVTQRTRPVRLQPPARPRSRGTSAAAASRRIPNKNRSK